MGDPIDLVDVIADPRRLDIASQTDRRLERRTIDRDSAANVLALPGPGAPRLASPTDHDEPPPPSRLQVKLEAGGLGPTATDSAARLRASWYGFERSRRLNVPGGDSAFDDLRVRVQELVAGSESRTRSDGDYGSAMHVDVRDTVSVRALPSEMPFSLDDQLLLGLVFQLTDECAIWWSDPFPIDGLG